MLTTVVLVLAGITAWCVASLALALIVGPMVRRADRTAAAERTTTAAERRTPLGAERRPLTGAIPIQIAH